MCCRFGEVCPVRTQLDIHFQASSVVSAPELDEGPHLPGGEPSVLRGHPWHGQMTRQRGSVTAHGVARQGAPASFNSPSPIQRRIIGTPICREPAALCTVSGGSHTVKLSLPVQQGVLSAELLQRQPYGEREELLRCPSFLHRTLLCSHHLRTSIVNCSVLFPLRSNYRSYMSLVRAPCKYRAKSASALSSRVASISYACAAHLAPSRGF